MTTINLNDDDTIMAINGKDTKLMKKLQKKIFVRKLLCRREETGDDDMDGYLYYLTTRELMFQPITQLLSDKKIVAHEPIDASMRLQKIEYALKAAGRRYPVFSSGLSQFKRRHEHPQLGSAIEERVANRSRNERHEERQLPKLIITFPVVYDYDVKEP